MGVAAESYETPPLAVPYERWLTQAESLQRQFEAGEPTRHLVLDDFLDPAVATAAMEAFPPLGDGWIHYLHYNERTFGMSDRAVLPPVLRTLIDELNAPRFVEFLEAITGLGQLRADDQLEGGGIHQSERGGYLNMHADFTVHPHKPRWRRSLNLLVYLNPDWQDAWRGQLELWDPQMQRCVQRISPRFNRAVLFQTHEHSYHGFPEPIQCPPGESRRALALYYFREEASERGPWQPATDRVRPMGCGSAR